MAVQLHYDASGMQIVVANLPQICAEGWRKRKAETNRRIHIRRLHDELYRAKSLWDRGQKSGVYMIALSIPDGCFWERWLAFANACFAPVLDRADAQYWIDRDQYVDWWQIAGLSQGARLDAERAAETWFAAALGAGD